jgi:hypothetical protein
MPRLKCGVDSCIFWHDRFCSRSGIQVKGDTALEEDETRCASYHKRDRISTNQNYNLEIGDIGLDMYLSVNCEAVNCKYNHNLMCHADEIKIDGSRAHNSKDTFCSSFDLK